MTDKEKLEAIKAEIHRLVDVRGYDREMANDLFAFMDSLPNEPVSEELEDITQKITYEGEVYTRCYKDKLDEFACKYPISVPKPPKRYAKYSDTDLTIAVKEGAKWQKEHLALTWEDINRIEIIIKDVYRDYPHGIETKQFGVEVLNRFNKQKGK